MPDEGTWDMIVTLGGDGTLLWASHLADANTPMLAINSAPDTSVGYFCAGDGHDVHEVLEAALGNQLKSSKLARMRVEVGTRVISTRMFSRGMPVTAWAALDAPAGICVGAMI